jgi:hypothetical protein
VSGFGLFNIFIILNDLSLLAAWLGYIIIQELSTSNSTENNFIAPDIFFVAESVQEKISFDVYAGDMAIEYVVASFKYFARISQKRVHVGCHLQY